MAIKDIEDLLVNVKGYLKTNLNTYITSINAEKSGFDVDTITADDKHYWVAGEMVDLPNRDFVAVGIVENVEAEVNGNDIKYIVILDARVVFAFGEKGEDYYKALRYARALEETMLEYESDTDEVSDLQIINVIPMLIQADKRKLISCGITISIAIA